MVMEFDYNKMLEEAMKKVPEKSEFVGRFKTPEIKSEIQGNKTVIQNFSEMDWCLRELRDRCCMAVVSSCCEMLG